LGIAKLGINSVGKVVLGAETEGEGAVGTAIGSTETTVTLFYDLFKKTTL
jgi:hypothetical protein